MNLSIGSTWVHQPLSLNSYYLCKQQPQRQDDNTYCNELTQIFSLDSIIHTPHETNM